METNKRVLKKEHLNTLASMNNLVRTWKKMGRDIKAIKLIGKCFQLRKKAININHPYILFLSSILTRWLNEL